jgi:hypothetical protein
MRGRGVRDASGASAVEFALVLPILLLLIFGIISFGWGFARWVELTGAAREGARYMAIHSGADAGALTAATTLAKSSAPLACGALGNDCQVPTDIPRCGPTVQDIEFEITMAEFSPFSIPGLPSLARPFTATATMQCGG